MFGEIAGAVLGALTGSFAGLIPGLHTNLLAVLIALMTLEPAFAVVFLASMAMARSVSDALPTVFLGATDSENVLGILPGQQLLQDGCGLDALKFCLTGSLLGTLFGLICIPFFIFLFPLLFKLIQPFLFWLLLAIVVFLVVKDSFWGAIIFVTTGILGLTAFRTTPDPLFPLLSGLFGVSGLVLSLTENAIVPEQEEEGILELEKSKTIIASVLGLLAGSFVTLFPGLSPAQSASIIQLNKIGSLGYLVMIGALGTVDVLVSFATWFALNKTRNGAVVIMEQLTGTLNAQTLVVVIAAAVVGVGIAIIITWLSGRLYARMFEFINYTWLCYTVILFLTTLAFILSGWRGLILLTAATGLGLLAPLTGASRTQAMGCLLLPTLIHLTP